MSLEKASLLSAAQVAVMFNVSAEAVRGWAETGKLRAFKTPGGHWRFTREDVDAFLPDQAATA